MSTEFHRYLHSQLVSQARALKVTVSEGMCVAGV
jgi:hypothetical protein